MLKLTKNQRDAIYKMKNGCILCGGVGSGKSLASLGYYYKEEGGDIETHPYALLENKKPKDLYIITTATKRDKQEWDVEMINFKLSTDPSFSFYEHNVIVDSWANIKKYMHIKNSFFIFDEQRVVGTGVWVTAFLKIAKVNNWILLSATPGDSWSDYIPVFIANGYYKNRKDFNDNHVIWARYVSWPKVDGYYNTKKLEQFREDLLIDMPDERFTKRHDIDVLVEYDMLSYKNVLRNRWNPFTDSPVVNAAELCYTVRKIINSDESRIEETKKLAKQYNRCIIFYNFDYELEILKSIDYGDEYEVREWNGHKHEPLPATSHWIYLVQYTAGAEGWNCTDTNVIIFYSQNYSYKIMEQARGRIDRMNTKYIDLYYYHLKSLAPIDRMISVCLLQKKKFNERKFVKW